MNIMAMIKCPGCSSVVSNAAQECPFCGARLRLMKRGFWSKLAKWGLAGFVILMVIWFFYTG